MLDYKDLPEISCIYKIVNMLQPTKFYIGSASNLRERVQKHIRELKQNKHHSCKLQRAVDKYGINNFNVHIIEFAKADRIELYKQEQKLIDLFEPVYNCSTQVFLNNYSNDTEIKEKIRSKIQGQFKNSNTGIANVYYSEGAYLVKVCRDNKSYQLCKYKSLEKAKGVAEKYRFASVEILENFINDKKNNKSTPYSGIYFRKSKQCYRVCLKVNGKQLEIGSSKSLDTAIRIHNNYITINKINKPLHIIKSE